MYAFFACNLLFDDEDEDYIQPKDPDSEYVEDLYGTKFADSQYFPKLVTYRTLTTFLELVTDLPYLDNFSKKSEIRKEKFNDYLQENIIFFFL